VCPSDDPPVFCLGRFIFQIVFSHLELPVGLFPVIKRSIRTMSFRAPPSRTLFLQWLSLATTRTSERFGRQYIVHQGGQTLPWYQILDTCNPWAFPIRPVPSPPLPCAHRLSMSSAGGPPTPVSLVDVLITPFFSPRAGPPVF